MEATGNRRKSQEITGSRGRSQEITGNFGGNHRKTPEITGNRLTGKRLLRCGLLRATLTGKKPADGGWQRRGSGNGPVRRKTGICWPRAQPPDWRFAIRNSPIRPSNPALSQKVFQAGAQQVVAGLLDFAGVDQTLNDLRARPPLHFNLAPPIPLPPLPSDGRGRG